MVGVWGKEQIKSQHPGFFWEIPKFLEESKRPLEGIQQPGIKRNDTGTRKQQKVELLIDNVGTACSEGSPLKDFSCQEDPENRLS